MKNIFGSVLLTGALLAAAGSGPLAAADCQTIYRLWQDGNTTYYKYGEVILLDVGEQADLYLHAYPSHSETPYSASAEIGAPSDFGVGGQRPQDVSRVLRLGKKTPHEGKISLTTVAAGQTALGYQIVGVYPPGRLEEVPSGCRIGQVQIRVRGGAAATQPGPLAVDSANDAVHQLIMQLYAGILRRGDAEAADYPDSFFEQVQQGGLQALISIAETMTSSSEFRQAALSRTSQGLEASGGSARGLSQEALEGQLLSDIFASLYGAGSQPYADARRRMAIYLSGCLSGRNAAEACQRLGRDLLTQPQYQGRNGDLLRYLR